MAYRIVHRAGPYIVRVKRGRPPLARIGTYYWIEGPGMPVEPPQSPDEAWQRIGLFNAPGEYVNLANMLADARMHGYNTAKSEIQE